MCVAVPFQVVDADAERARVSRGGRIAVVSLLAMTEPLFPGDWVLVHSGFVLATLTPAEAADSRPANRRGRAVIRGATRRTPAEPGCCRDQRGVASSSTATAFAPSTTRPSTRRARTPSARFFCSRWPRSGRRGRVGVTRPSGGSGWVLPRWRSSGGACRSCCSSTGSRGRPRRRRAADKTLVVWVVLLAVPLLGERFGALQVAAVALLVLGQAMASGSTAAFFGKPFGTGEAEILAATMLWAVEVVIAKRLLGSLRRGQSGSRGCWRAPCCSPGGSFSAATPA